MSRTIVFSLLSFLIAGCLGNNCTNEVREELVSPNGLRKIVIFSRNCGATTGINTQASVLNKKEKLLDAPGNIFVVDQGAAKVSWKDDGAILVVLEHGSRVFKKESFVSGIAFEYREK